LRGTCQCRAPSRWQGLNGQGGVDTAGARARRRSKNARTILFETDLASSVKRLLLFATLIACSHQPSTAKPRPEPSAGTGRSLSRQANTAIPASAAGIHESPKPFLLHPALGDVRLALEAQDDELAAAALQAGMTVGGAFGSGCLQCSYLLGVIEERQGAVSRAIAAFENATLGDWALKRDALLHLVGLELGRKNCARAEDLLTQVATLAPEELRVTSQRVQADLCQQRTHDAAVRLRGLIGATTDENRRSEYQLLLAQVLVEQAQLGGVERNVAEQEAVQLAREALQNPAPGSLVLERARTLLEQILARHQRLGTGDQLLNERMELLDAFVEDRHWVEGHQLAQELLGYSTANAGQHQLQCRVLFASGRIANATGDRRSAIEAFDWVTGHCEDPDLAARALFLGAGLELALGKRAAAIAKYAELERRFSAHRLADDARLKQANVYRAMGSESQFVSLLDAMPDAYPKGDMVSEGLFQLALKHMLQRNWPSALAVLERSERWSVTTGRTKDNETDRQKYFLGRANIEAGRVELGLKLLRELVIQRPLTYYMLLAYSKLIRLGPAAAADALREGLAGSGEQVPPAQVTTEQDLRRIERLSALLGVADVTAADMLLQEPGAQRICERAWFDVAGMYANAGATKTALTLVKRRGRDWRVRWPSAGWLPLWQQAFPRPYRDIVRREVNRNGVGESLVYAIMREESEFDSQAKSSAGAFGLMQVIVPTARIAGRKLGISANARSLLKPNVNIAIGTKVLGDLSERFGGQVAMVAAAYNAGPGRPARWLRNSPDLDLDLWIELIEYSETRAYVKRVIESQAAYRWLYGTDEDSGTTIDVLPAQLKPGQAG
jgi:soluble lytic murein transglycosylase